MASAGATYDAAKAKAAAMWSDYAKDVQSKYQSKVSTAPLATTLPGLTTPFVQTLQKTLETPGLGQAAIDRRIAGEMDRFSESERDAGLNLKTAAGAMGFGKSGSLAGGLQKMQSDYVGQRGAARQGIYNDADLLASGEKMGALNIASRPVLQERAFEQNQQLNKATGGGEGFNPYAGLPGMTSSNGQAFGIASQGTPDPGRGGRGNSLGGGPKIIGGGTGVRSSDPRMKGPGVTLYKDKTPYGVGTFLGNQPFKPFGM